MKIIIRDDDVGFFTPASTLQKIYGPLFKKKIPVLLSVIPYHSTDTEIPAFLLNHGIDYELNFPKAFSGTRKSYAVHNNRALMGYLRPLVKNNLIEIAQHGCHHTLKNNVYEFAMQDQQELEKRLLIGKTLLEKEFDKILTFTAPWDALSFEAVSVLLKHQLSFFVNKKDLLRSPLRLSLHAPALFMKQHSLVNQVPVFLVQDYFFGTSLVGGSKEEIDASFDYHLERLSHASVGILANHYWWYQQGTLCRYKLQKFHALIDALVERKAEFVTCRDFRKHK